MIVSFDTKVNDEQQNMISQLRQYIRNLKHLEKQIHVNEATSKIMLPVFQTATHSAKIMEQTENLSVRIQDMLRMKE